MGGLIELVDELAKEAETEKMKVSVKTLTFKLQSKLLSEWTCCTISPYTGHWSQEPVKISGKAEGSSATATAGPDSREEDATWEVQVGSLFKHWGNLHLFFEVHETWLDMFLIYFRYRIEYEALSKVEAEQTEFIDQFILQKWRF